MMKVLLLALAATAALGGCHSAQSPQPGAAADETAASATPTGAGAGATAAADDRADTRPYSGIEASETVHFTGTEPFWGGQVSGTTLTYSTPDHPDGEPIAVKRFAGRAGVSWSGTYQDRPFTLAVTEGRCSDGMSDRSYPFTATLRVLDEQRQGCGWSDRRGIAEPKAP